VRIPCELRNVSVFDNTDIGGEAFEFTFFFCIKGFNLVVLIESLFRFNVLTVIAIGILTGFLLFGI